VKAFFQKLFNNFSEFYKNNSVYMYMLCGYFFLIILSSIIFPLLIDDTTKKYLWVGTSWEILSSILTIVYSIYFWFCNDEGKKILDMLGDNKKTIRRFMVFAFINLILIVVANVVNSINFYWGPLSMLFAILTFGAFVFIDQTLLDELNKNSNTNKEIEKIRKDVDYVLSNSDIPTLVAFAILFVYAIFMYNRMQLFFSGAIAFQMLISTVIWANTEITNVRGATTEITTS